MEANRPDPETMRRVAEGQAGLNEIYGVPREQLEAIAMMGFNFYEQGRISEAGTVFRGLVAVDPDLYFGHAGLGALALRDARVDDAISHLRRAAELNAEDPTVHANLGEALLRKGTFEEAAVEFGKALDLDPEEMDPGANRARAILQGMRAISEEA